MTIHIQFEVTPTTGRPEELVGHAHFLNQGDAPVSFIPVQLKSASLALEMVDREGHPVLLPPPPVPDPQPSILLRTSHTCLTIPTFSRHGPNQASIDCRHSSLASQDPTPIPRQLLIGWP